MIFMSFALIYISCTFCSTIYSSDPRSNTGLSNKNTYFYQSTSLSASDENDHAEKIKLCVPGLDCPYVTTLTVGTLATCAACITTGYFTHNWYWLTGCIASPLIAMPCATIMQCYYAKKETHQTVL